MLGIDEYIDEQGRRTYNGEDIIPPRCPIFVFVYIGYLAADVGIGLFYEINYWFREPEHITTTAIVTEEKWDYETHEGHAKYRTHYVNVLELPEEHREIKAVDGYIHCYPTGTEFDLIYSKGFFGIDILEGVDNVRYPSVD